MGIKHILILLLLVIGISRVAFSQNRFSFHDKLVDFPGNFIARSENKLNSINSRLEKKTEIYLNRLLKTEKKLRRRLWEIDSIAARAFADIEQKYDSARWKMKDTAAGAAKHFSEYLPYADSLKTSLSFLRKNDSLLENGDDTRDKVQGSLKQFDEVQSKFGQAETIQTFIRQRKEKIKQILSRYTSLPAGLQKTYDNFSKDYYYYTQQIKEYRDLLNNPDKLFREALSFLNQLPAFKDFARQYSELAGLFASASNYGAGQTFTGLQTRSQVQQLLQSQLPTGGIIAQSVIQQNLQAARNQVNQLKDKINKMGGGSSDAEMPEFKPNNQKTKSFLQRLEIGTNLQSSKSNVYFPTTTDLGLSLGYKLSDKSIIGIGSSYKIGWGKDINHIAFSSQGIGLRSFLDVKLKKSFYLSGGFECNYQALSPDSILVDQNAAAWTQSGLMGLSKVVSLKTKFFKKTKVQLLWDFLSYQQQPKTQAVKFRVGYNF